jgi:hypothetical protein
VIEASDPNSRPRSSQDEQKTWDVITTPASPSLRSISHGFIDCSPVSKAPASDEDIVDPDVSHGDLRPPSLTRAGSNLDDLDEDTTRQSLSDSPAIANHATATNEASDPVANPTLAHSPPDFRANHPPDGNCAAHRATIQIPSPSSSSSPAPPPPSSEVGTNLPGVAANVVGDEQARINAGAPHLAIEVGSPTGLEQSEEVAEPGDGAPEDQARLEDAVVRVDSPN